MRLIILILMFTVNANAENWFPVGKLGAKTTYVRKAQCESTEGQRCFDISGKDMRRFKKGLVNNLDRPKHQPMDPVPCTDAESCQPLLEAIDCSAHGEGAYGMIKIDFSQVHCAVPNGFMKKDGLVPDPDGIESADTADALKASDAIKRKDKQDTRNIKLSSCAKMDTMTMAQLISCTRANSRELRKHSLLESEL